MSTETGRFAMLFYRDDMFQQLREGCFQVFPWHLTFPRKTFLAPYIGPAFTARRFRCLFFKSEPLTHRVSGDRVENTKQRAMIVEMALRTCTFLHIGGAPFGDEILRGHTNHPASFSVL